MPAPRMSSQLDQTSAILGEYMLKGWTLTDLHCDSCRVTPLMREPAAAAQREGRSSIQFCALCDGSPAGQTTTAITSSTSPPSSSSNQPSAPFPTKHDIESSSYAANSEDPASQISSLLLKGYSLLGTNCPNSTCRGIPLVGFPRKADKTKDGRRMCVSCHGRWVEEGNMGGLKIVAPPRMKDEETRDDKSSLDASEVLRSPREKRRRELYGLDTPSVGKQDSKGKKREDDDEDEDDFDVDMDIEGPIPPPKEAASQNLPSLAENASLDSALHAAQSSLALTLSRLAISLEQHHTSDEARYFVDVKLHTEAMRDVLDVLERMKRVIS